MLFSLDSSTFDISISMNVRTYSLQLDVKHTSPLIICCSFTFFGLMLLFEWNAVSVIVC